VKYLKYLGGNQMRKLVVGMMLVLACRAAVAQDAFQQWKAQQDKEFQAFKDERDRAFAAMLKEAWQFIKEQEAMKLYSKPKVEEAPVATVSAPKPTAPKKLLPASITPAPRTNNVAAAPGMPPTAPGADPQRNSAASLQLNWFGISTSLPYDPAWKSLKLAGRTDKDISAFFEQLARSEYESTVAALVRQQQTYSLNDWALGMAAEHFAASVFAGPDEQVLLTWFLLAKTGYAVKIGYNTNGVYLLVPTDVNLFSISFFTMNGKRFYATGFSKRISQPGALYTYEGTYPKATRTVAVQIQQLPLFPEEETGRSVKFTWNDTTYTVKLHYNRNAVAFLEKYPQADIPVYFRGKLSQKAEESLVSALKPLVSGRSEWDAVNLLLRFVQTAFAYQTDEEQFGFEKYFFAEETLHYPFSDCEDRAILFAYLVRTLLGNDVVALKYPGHLATAVAFKIAPPGDAFEINGKLYTVCDPTYINADAGMTMPDFRETMPQVVAY
jgi:hypothetical protein